MGSVSIHAPKTPVTKSCNSVAAATVPNVCKMPGPPAPFVPTPLPNIGRSSLSPQGYSTTVKIDGSPVAIRGASFGSMGDIASRGTGGGIISMNCEGPTKFIAPGSLSVKIEGRNVHLLADVMSNNNGPSGSPPNAATLAGTIHSPLPPTVPAPGELDRCDHVWVLEKPGKTPAEAAAANNATIAAKQSKPTMASNLRGLAFENKAVADNMEEMKIKSVSQIYRCVAGCKAEQEVDIAGEDQVAESKSRNFKGVKRKGDQSRKVRDIQHKVFSPAKNPRAKLDGSLPDADASAAKYLARGFDVEKV